MDKEIILLREKGIYGLPKTITKREQEMLEDDVPVQKIIGYIEFDDVRINLNHKVLIPRYETEEVVHKALDYINKDSKVLDLCTGSGYIGLTIKKRTCATVTMSDIDLEAILQSQENSKLNNLDVEIIQSDLFANIKGKYDVIVANPPYIPTATKLPDSVIKHEPTSALYAGDDGNDFYNKILNQVENYLLPNGVVIFEISPDNCNFLKEKGFEIINDINSKQRVAIKKY